MSKLLSLLTKLAKIAGLGRVAYLAVADYLRRKRETKAREALSRAVDEAQKEKSTRELEDMFRKP